MSVLKETLPFRTIDNRRAAGELALTLCAYATALLLALFWRGPGWMVGLPAACAGIAAVRLYMLQHDCMHRSFCQPRWLNDVIGVALSPLTLTPFYAGRYNHGQHHSHVGDLDQRDTFEINVLTVAEYRARGPWARLAYRLYRSPVVLVAIGPILVFGLINRCPRNTFKAGLWRDVLLHNALLGGYLAAIYLLAGSAGLWTLLLANYIGVSLGAVIPYVEHNFETVEWGRKPELSFEDAALKGSAVLDFGALFHFVTANIGYHDLHHLNPQVPSYHLKACHEALEARGHLNSRKVGWRAALQSFRWKLWDEEAQRMVTFAAAHPRMSWPQAELGFAQENYLAQLGSHRKGQNN
ncbi:fatty acid desaturase [Cognatishimia sp. SS12]|uniref:fatty acid desaturase n=1 Tax=Cognatishimia sp. SS12 TaxID=2979465 RepID=UPI00232BBA4B|nr:fatty acid desaturase [Cognatishimia sp. SS12]MDC0738539.1 fatty acid desaturase [Cognatishimia sp. SS12]